jgi:hypothetical protein
MRMMPATAAENREHPEGKSTIREIPMISLNRFLRRIPTNILQAYFVKASIPLAAGEEWSLALSHDTRGLKQLLDRLFEGDRARLMNDAERIGGMSDEPGQAALLGVLPDHKPLKPLQNGHARAAWVFVNEPDSFRRAEEARFTDERRRGRMWSGYAGERNCSMVRSAEVLDRFRSAVRKHYGSQNVHVDLFDREKKGLKGEIFRLAQATIYRDGLPDDVPEFHDGKLAWRPRKPVYEAAVTYEPKSGSIEVVADNRKSHAYLARMFAQEFLGSESGEDELPLREFSLDILLRPYNFPTDAEDGIESVKVTQLRVMPVDSEGERLTLECTREHSNTIWGMAAQRFGQSNPLDAGWVATKAKLVIRFHPDKEARRSKVLPITVTMPHGCDLKDRTTHENLIGQKYLQRWQLVKHV